MRKARYRNRALIVLSDGDDNDSVRRLDDAAAAFSASPVPVFFLMLIRPERRVLKEARDIHNRNSLIDFAERSGGTSAIVSDKKQLIDMTRAISQLIRNPYILRIDAPVAPIEPRDLQVQVPSIRPRPILLYRRLWRLGRPAGPNRRRLAALHRPQGVAGRSRQDRH